MIRGGGVPRRYLAFAVPQNGPAAPQRCRRCAWLHHGRGLQQPRRIQGCGAIAPRQWHAPLGYRTISIPLPGRWGMLRVKARAGARPLRGCGLDPSAFPIPVARHGVGAKHRFLLKNIVRRPRRLTVEAPYKGPPACRAAKLAGVASQARGFLLRTTGTRCAVDTASAASCKKPTACHNPAPSRQSSETKHTSRGRLLRM